MTNPSFSLELVKQRIRQLKYRVTVTALETASLMGFLQDEIVDCVLNIDESHFYKTMPAEKAPGLMQDVYKIRYEGQRVYVKLQVNRSDEVVIISFKEDES